MSRGVPVVDTSHIPAGAGEADDFARSVRSFALEAREALGGKGSTMVDLIALERRVSQMLRQAPGTHSLGIAPWLMAVHRRIEARLRECPDEDRETLVA